MRLRIVRWSLALLLCCVSAVGAQSQLIAGGLVVVGPQNYCASVVGTDSYACTLDRAVTVYPVAGGSRYAFKADVANTGPASINFSGIGAKAIKVWNGTTKIDPPSNTICIGQVVEVLYDGTDMQMISQPCTAALAGLATALAANGANCAVAGTFPNGVDASGASENCVTLGGVNPQTTTYQVLAADFDAYKTITVASGTFTVTLVASGAQPATGKYLRLLNYGTGVVTIARSGQNINGAAANVTLAAGSASAPTAALVLSDGTNYFVSLATSGGGGGSGTVNTGAAAAVAYYPSATTAVDDSTGLTLNATTVLTRKDAVTAVAADTTLGAHNIVLVTTSTTDRTMTLPAASSTTVGHYVIIKADTGSGDVLLAPNGSDTLNGVNASKAITTQFEYMEATLISTTGWHVITGLLGIDGGSLADGSVTLAKLASMATASFLGRNTAGTGVPEVLSVATAKTLLNLTGTNSGDQTITLTGDVTGTGTGSFAATIANNAVTLGKMADMATASFLGRNTAATGDPEVLSIATAKTMLNLTGTNSGDQTITLTGDVTGSGTGSFATTLATVPVSKGGTGAAPGADDQVFVSSSTAAGAWQSLPNCTDVTGNHLNYTTATNAFSCGTSSSGGGGSGITGATANAPMYATGATTATSTAALTNGQLLIGSTGAAPVAAALTGTANQVAVTNSAGGITLAIPSSPTLPGTTTGTFSGALTGNASTATALAANGANCTVAGTFPNGVDASGVAENCVTLSAVNPQTGTYQVLAADFDSYKTITVASGTFTITLVASGTQPANGKYINLLNYGTGVVTIARSGQNINGGTANLVLAPGTATNTGSAHIYSDGTNYFADVDSPYPMVSSIVIPAGSMDVSGGCTATAAAALVTNGPKLATITCTDADVDSIEFDWLMPDGWNAGTITVTLDAFSIGNNTTEVFEMDFAGQCVRTGDSPAAHSTTGEQPATITWGASANREQTATTAAITLNGTCAAGAHVYMRGQVDATASTMAPFTDLRLLGVKIEYTRNSAD